MIRFLVNWREGGRVTLPIFAFADDDEDDYLFVYFCWWFLTIAMDTRRRGVMVEFAFWPPWLARLVGREYYTLSQMTPAPPRTKCTRSGRDPGR